MRKNHRQMKRLSAMAVAALILSIFLTGCGSKDEVVIDVVGQDYSFEDSPCKRPDGEPFHIAFMDLGPPIESSWLCLKGFAEGLQSMGYIDENIDFTQAPEEFYAYYDFLNANNKGDMVVFDKEPYMIGMDRDQEIADTLVKEASEGNLDIVVATGTDPGLFLKDLNLPIPFLVCLATDPVGAGIIDSPENTGNENIWAMVEPNPFRHQFAGYRKMLGFDNICIVSVEGLDDINGNPLYHEEAREQGLNVVDIVMTEEQSLKDNYGQIIRDKLESSDLGNSEAILFVYGTMDGANAPLLSEYSAQKGLPSLIGDGDDICESGGMMCLSCFDYEGYGHFAASVASNVFHGQKAGEQPCLYTSSPHVVLNMTTAKNTGYKTGMDFLRSVDKIFR